jgi:hypothetical protein
LRVQRSEGPQCAVADDSHERSISRIEINAISTEMFIRNFIL